MGLGSLTKFWKQASQQDILLCIAGANKNVRSLINLVNLDKRIKLFGSVEEALS
jgi:anti-anti-sigma regulatory factor